MSAHDIFEAELPVAVLCGPSNSGKTSFCFYLASLDLPESGPSFKTTQVKTVRTYEPFMVIDPAVSPRGKPPCWLQFRRDIFFFVVDAAMIAGVETLDNQNYRDALRREYSFLHTAVITEVIPLAIILNKVDIMRQHEWPSIEQLWSVLGHNQPTTVPCQHFYISLRAPYGINALDNPPPHGGFANWLSELKLKPIIPDLVNPSLTYTIENLGPDGESNKFLTFQRIGISFLCRSAPASGRWITVRPFPPNDPHIADAHWKIFRPDDAPEKSATIVNVDLHSGDETSIYGCLTWADQKSSKGNCYAQGLYSATGSAQAVRQKFYIRKYRKGGKWRSHLFWYFQSAGPKDLYTISLICASPSGKKTLGYLMVGEETDESGTYVEVSTQKFPLEDAWRRHWLIRPHH